MNIYDKELWALKPEAKRFVLMMAENGVDTDLAVAFLESLCGVEEVYSLDGSSDEDVL